MAGQIPQNSVWSAMSYTPPRGRCNHKASLMTPAATSFECDGCSHHASFHSLENAADDAVLKKWAVEEASDKEKQQQTLVGASNKKRKVITQAAPSASDEVQEIPGGWRLAKDAPRLQSKKQPRKVLDLSHIDRMIVSDPPESDS